MSEAYKYVCGKLDQVNHGICIRRYLPLAVMKHHDKDSLLKKMSKLGLTVPSERAHGHRGGAGRQAGTGAVDESSCLDLQA